MHRSTIDVAALPFKLIITVDMFAFGYSPDNEINAKCTLGFIPRLTKMGCVLTQFVVRLLTRHNYSWKLCCIPRARVCMQLALCANTIRLGFINVVKTFTHAVTIN